MICVSTLLVFDASTAPERSCFVAACRSREVAWRLRVHSAHSQGPRPPPRAPQPSSRLGAL
eukprot:561663-Amphidinium_carterae.1